METQRFLIRGVLDTQRFEESWQHVIAADAALRTVFLWDGMAEPMQVVRRRSHTQLKIEDWRDRSGAEADLDKWFEDIAAPPFDVSRGSLMRLALVTLEDERHVFMWCRHHLILDGWSSALLMRQVLDTYAALVSGQSAPSLTGRPFAELVSWLRAQDRDAARGSLADGLRGVSGPTPIGFPSRALRDEPARRYARNCFRQMFRRNSGSSRVVSASR